MVTLIGIVAVVKQRSLNACATLLSGADTTIVSQILLHYKQNWKTFRALKRFAETQPEECKVHQMIYHRPIYISQTSNSTLNVRREKMRELKFIYCN